MQNMEVSEVAGKRVTFVKVKNSRKPITPQLTVLKQSLTIFAVYYQVFVAIS
jgi:hypothetical protein